MLPKCFGDMVNTGFNKNCDQCNLKYECYAETNKKLKDKINSIKIIFGDETKYCSLNAVGECE